MKCYMKGKAKKKPTASKAPKRSGSKEKNGTIRLDDAESPDLDSILNEVALESEKKPREHWAQIQCPYCGENFEVHLDSVEDGQTMYQDCQVCCKPISMHVQVDEEDVHVSAYRA